MPRTRKDEARRGEVVVLSQHEVSREVAGGPRLEDCRRVGAEFDEEIAELLTLGCVEGALCHIAGL
jgi:hypothetical protein